MPAESPETVLPLAAETLRIHKRLRETGRVRVSLQTETVEEVVRHGENGLLVDFFDPAEIAATVTDALKRPDDFRDIRRAARQTVIDRYDLTRVCLPRQLALIQRMIG